MATLPAFAFRIAFRTSLLVGTVLTVVNHGPQIYEGVVGWGRGLQIFFCYLVPFLVSFYSQRALWRRFTDATAATPPGGST